MLTAVYPAAAYMFAALSEACPRAYLQALYIDVIWHQASTCYMPSKDDNEGAMSGQVLETRGALRPIMNRDSASACAFSNTTTYSRLSTRQQSPQLLAS